MTERLAVGDALILFPEGTSGDGNRVLPFKSALFSAAEKMQEIVPIAVQPVSIAYTRLDGIPLGRLLRPFFAWYGTAELAPHLWSMIGLGTVEVVVEFHPPTFYRRLRVAQGARPLLPCAGRRRHGRRAGRAAAAGAGAAVRRAPLPAISVRRACAALTNRPEPGIVAERVKGVTKRVFIATYGCQMNVYDSARMAELLAPLGFDRAASAEDADLVILNTCHIREKAAEKVFSELGKIRALKARKARRGEAMLIAVAGCVAQAEGAEIRRRAPFVDLVFGPQTYHRLPELVARALRAGGRGVVDTSFPGRAQIRPSAAGAAGPGGDRLCDRAGRLRQVLHILRRALYPRRRVFAPGGADPRRGAPARWPWARARSLCSGRTSTPITAKGPDGGEWGLGDLVRALAELPGLDRIRYTTSHPRDVDEPADRRPSRRAAADAVSASAGAERLRPRAGGDEPAPHRRRLPPHRRALARGAAGSGVVHRSDRRLSRRERRRFSGHPRSRRRDRLCPGVFVQIFAAPRHARRHRPRTRCPDAVKIERLAALQALLARQQRDFNAACVGRVLPVLLEKPGRHQGQLVGRSPYLQSVHLAAAADRVGDIVPALISGAGQNSLSGMVAA